MKKILLTALLVVSCIATVAITHSSPLIQVGDITVINGNGNGNTDGYISAK